MNIVVTEYYVMRMGISTKETLRMESSMEWVTIRKQMEITI